ncbi:YraN family protein [Corynebacterium guangdongense]|uniref:UPF0102 protein J2S39_001280 n=1 Tax=Corynebacterium guangdongense TaxID=1783348 RepID=A0ABU1ZXE7_9CORY|nr:YraN family protein [Corynebacterium guangdongense]MDR7329604.1 putative endonuclease [Corynebacterium guangdongense]WJZ18169.1 hypothetical protein CGUA_08035 [Corynebacterium guangdongense]
MATSTTNSELGRRGEDAAAAHYISQGYVLLDRNVRYDVGELDLVLRSPGGEVVFVEVKTRSGRGFGGAEAVSGRKFARMRRTAARWLGGRHWQACRFDVAELVVSRTTGDEFDVTLYEGVDSGAR